MEMLLPYLKAFAVGGAFCALGQVFIDYTKLTLQFCRAKHKGQFREEHPAEIALYESARKFLQGQSADGRLPSIKLLKAEKEQLLHKKKEAQKTYHYYRDYQKELNTVCSNVDKILGQARTRQPEKQKGADIS